MAMKTLLSITHAMPTGDLTLSFGSPETQEEMRQMYQLRYHVYIEQKQYISAIYGSDGLEIDEHDRAGSCSYFVARYGTRLVGTARLILQTPLPIETHWRYEVPDDLRGMRPDETMEFSRLLVNHACGVRMPPRLVPLGLMQCGVLFCQAQGIRVAYASLQPRLLRYLESWGLPVQRLESACYIGNVTAMRYWENAAETVCPVYFQVAEVGAFFERAWGQNYQIAF